DLPEPQAGRGDRQVAGWPQAHPGAEGAVAAGHDRLGNPEPARGRAHRLHGHLGVRLQVRTDPQPAVHLRGHPALMVELARGSLSKMKAQLDAPVQYAFRLGDEEVPVNPLIGKTLRLEYLGAIHCSHCGRRTKTSFSQGYCYPCMQKLAQCDICIMSPERCHFEAGTCREPSWGEQFCMTDHIVYLANSSGVKVGITRASQVPTRWIDQGATQALPILRVATRQQSGFVEDLLRSQVADKTNWRALLKGDAAPVDLIAIREQVLDACAGGITALQ